ncbi:MAG: hypothetical protein GY792_30705 [Gammaproteobacteria bacterium]|nr:hypothetical protein [Gammaproteobacteria bacterium]
MNLFRRITTTFTAGVDRVVCQIENHDALVKANIRQVQQSVAEGKVRLARVQKERGHLATKLAELKNNETRWAERARELAAGDKEKALACLKRRKACQAQISHYTDLVARQKTLESEMVTQLSQMQARLDEIKLTHNRMRSRSASAEVQRVAQHLNTSGRESLDDVIERWEVKLTEAEIENGGESGVAGHGDPLENEFIAREMEAELNAELDALLEEENENE